MKTIIVLLLIMLLLSTCSCSTNPPGHMERMEVDLSSNEDPHNSAEILLIRCQQEQQEQCYHVVMATSQMNRIMKAVRAYNLLKESI